MDTKEMVRELKKDKEKRQENMKSHSELVAKDIAKYLEGKAKGRKYFI